MRSKQAPISHRRRVSSSLRTPKPVLEVSSRVDRVSSCMPNCDAARPMTISLRRTVREKARRTLPSRRKQATLFLPQVATLKPCSFRRYVSAESSDSDLRNAELSRMISCKGVRTGAGVMNCVSRRTRLASSWRFRPARPTVGGVSSGSGERHRTRDDEPEGESCRLRWV